MWNKSFITLYVNYSKKSESIKDFFHGMRNELSTYCKLRSYICTLSPSYNTNTWVSIQCHFYVNISNYLEDFDIGLWLPCTRCLLEISELMCHTCDIGILCQHLKCTLSVSALVSLGGQPYKQSPTSNWKQKSTAKSKFQKGTPKENT